MAQMVAGEAGLGCRGRPRRVSFVLTLWNKPKISPRHSPPVQVFVRPQRPERGASTHVRLGEAEFGNLRPGPIHSRASTTLYSAGLTDGRRVNRMSRRVSGSLAPLKQAISISSRRRMASRPFVAVKIDGKIVSFDRVPCRVKSLLQNLPVKWIQLVSKRSEQNPSSTSGATLRFVKPSYKAAR